MRLRKRGKDGKIWLNFCLETFIGPFLEHWASLFRGITDAALGLVYLIIFLTILVFLVKRLDLNSQDEKRFLIKIYSFLRSL